MTDDGPYECSRYVYNAGGERIHFITKDDWDIVQRAGREGLRHIRLAQPPSEWPRLASNLVDTVQKTITGEVFEWRHRSLASYWALRFTDQDDAETYRSWHPDCRIEA